VSDHVPSAELVFRIEARCEPPQVLGERDGGRMLMIPITGGAVEGPKLTGEVLPGADWATVFTDRAQVEARYAIRAANGTVIQVFNRGTVAIGADGTQPALPLTVLTFVAPAGEHGWLNNGPFIGTLDANPASMGLVKVGVYRMV
jgi:hypothetical protein